MSNDETPDATLRAHYAYQDAMEAAGRAHYAQEEHSRAAGRLRDARREALEAEGRRRDAVRAADMEAATRGAESPPPTLSAAALEANAERAARGHAVIAAYPHDDDTATLAGDIIADLLHAIAATEGWDRTPEDVARVALAHYQAERDGDALDY